MKISEIIAGASKPFPSIEIVPPMTGISKKELLDTIRPFMEFCPPYINVTRHRDEYEFVPRPDGTFQKRLVVNRVSPTAVCATIQSEFKTEVVPHIICAGASADRIASQLQDFRFLGIENVMALRGDSLNEEKRFIPEPDGYRYASEMVGAIKNFSAKNEIDFCIGVGAYPEKHFEAANMEEDIANLKKKVDAGADFIITQMFFDNAVFYSFCKRCREVGITVPIIPGLKPLSAARQLEFLPQAFSIDIPLELSSQMRAAAADKQACFEIGRDWCRAQCKDLLDHGVKAIHFYTMGRQDNVIDILKTSF